MISIIITSFKEPKTIGKCIKCIANPNYSGIKEPFEVIQVSPDKETLEAGKKAAKDLNLKKFIQIKDPKRGKPFALNLAFKKARGNILILTDGDTYMERNAIKYLLKPFRDKKVGGVSGRPKAINNRNTFMGYIGHLLVDAGDYRRKKVMKKTEKGYYVSDEKFFPMSGYIMATRKEFTNVPPNTLSDDAYISYNIRNQGLEIAYEPRAIAYIKTPTTIKDYFKQKVRSLGGYIQLKKMGVMQRDKQSRGFFTEVRHTTFALFYYPRNFREFIWSVILHFLRLYLWLLIFIKQILKQEDMPQNGWERVESTK